MTEQDLGKENFRPLKIYFRACEQTSSAYFGRSLVSGREFEKKVETMAKHLEKIGHTITSEDIVSWELQQKLREEAEHSGDYESYIFEHHIKALKEAGLAIFEVSQKSSGIGSWEDCCMVHVLNMPVILMRDKASGYYSPTFLGDYSPLVRRFEYDNNDYQQVLEAALKWATTEAREVQTALQF